LHLLTTATLARLSELGPASQFDVRRFRPNVVVETAEDQSGFVENGWVGRTVAIGDDVRLRVSDPTPRCSIPTLAQTRLPMDPKVLRTIVEHNRLAVPVLEGKVLPCAGVYAFVIQGGTLRRGDPVRIE
ncbi:MAG: MOSC domain-containing protein, partial [Kiloniellales bacterium]|nr:MOSC domain-containing protein [Kiloniellales bacterium]